MTTKHASEYRTSAATASRNLEAANARIADLLAERRQLVEALRVARNFVSDSQGPNGRTAAQLMTEWSALLRSLGEL